MNYLLEWNINELISGEHFVEALYVSMLKEAHQSADNYAIRGLLCCGLIKPEYASMVNTGKVCHIEGCFSGELSIDIGTSIILEGLFYFKKAIELNRNVLLPREIASKALEVSKWVSYYARHYDRYHITLQKRLYVQRAMLSAGTILAMLAGEPLSVDSDWEEVLSIFGGPDMPYPSAYSERNKEST